MGKQQASVDGIQKEHQHKLNPDKDLVVNKDGIIIQYEFNYDSSHIYSSGKIYFKDGKEREARFFKFEKSEEDLAKKIFTLTSKLVNYEGVDVLKPHFLTYYEPQNIWILCTEKFDHLLSEIKMDVEDRVDGDSWWQESIRDLLQMIKDIHSHMLFHNGLNQTDNYVVVSDTIKIINVQSNFEDLENPENLSNIHVLRMNDLKAFRNMLKENEAFWELTGFGFVGTPKLSELEAGAIPGWVTPLGSCSVSSQKQNRAGWNSEVKRVEGWSNPMMGDHPGKLLRELPETNPCGSLGNSEVKRVEGWSNPMMGDHPGKLLRDSWPERDAFFDFFDNKEFTYPLFVERLASHPFLLTAAERMKCFDKIWYSANESKFKRILDGRAFHKYRKWNRKDMVREFQEVYNCSYSTYDGESVWDLVVFLKDIYVHHNPRDLTLEAADAEVKRLYPNFLEKIYAII
ncbi:hypothetical protein L3X38_039692 [Prunus dulcis]|uniref:Protein kinase domain-containing protein n=1 Tax=Prunus dulcis TaxID=3755 RepID=A0AAD4V8X6_PRUDU|nr:hypothetical protein L3X38_039692 [Prunus dulcis]